MSLQFFPGGVQRHVHIHIYTYCKHLRIHIPHTYTHMNIYIYINRFCKTLFHSTARSGLSKTKVRMVEATILKHSCQDSLELLCHAKRKFKPQSPAGTPQILSATPGKKKNLKYLYLFSRVPRPFLFIKITPVQCLAPLSTHSGRFVGGGLSRYCGEKGAYASSLPPWSLEQRFCKTLFRSTARSGLSKLKVRMAKATILKTFLQGFP